MLLPLLPVTFIAPVYRLKSLIPAYIPLLYKQLQMCKNDSLKAHVLSYKKCMCKPSYGGVAIIIIAHIQNTSRFHLPHIDISRMFYPIAPIQVWHTIVMGNRLTKRLRRCSIICDNYPASSHFWQCWEGNIL